MSINDVDPKNASYLEMLAYATHSDVQGFTYDSNNLAGYLSFKKFYDYMAEGGSEK